MISLSRPYGRRMLARAGIATLVASSLVVAPAAPAHAELACTVTYQRSWDNGSRFGADITIRNAGPQINNWTLTFTFPGDQRIGWGWSATWRQEGRNVTAASLPWNGRLATGASTTIGFSGTYTGTNTDPVDFAINGVPCNRPPQPPTVIVNPSPVSVPEDNMAPVSLRLSAQPVANVTVTISAGSGDPDLTMCGSGSPTITFTPANWNSPVTTFMCAADDADTVNGMRNFSFGGTPVTATEIDDDAPLSKADNPFAGASGYVNPDWQGQVNAQAATVSGPLAEQMRTVGQQSTAIWLDRIAAITAGRGLAGHLDAAVAQDAANGSAPVVLTLVLYNLPNRNCQLAEGSSELTIDGGLARYQTEFIDAIGAILARPEYAALRVAIVVEPWSLYSHVAFDPPNQWTTLRCVAAHQSGVYRMGIRYAINRLSALRNTYMYLDVSNSGWLGWDSNFATAVNVFDNVIAASAGGPGYDKVHGLAANVAGYVATEEIFLPDTRLAVSGVPLLQTRWIDWNPRIDERDYVTELLAALTNRGCTGCGALIDTSRNGWGGPNRPPQLQPANDPNTYVDQNRLDRRPHRSGYCNQVGAGIGARPTANTAIAGVDAFVWVKPPGESDGTGIPSILDPDDPNRLWDPMCDPMRYNRYNDNHATNAMPGGPHFGRWFPAQFEALVRNAHPPIG